MAEDVMVMGQEDVGTKLNPMGKRIARMAIPFFAQALATPATVTASTTPVVGNVGTVTLASTIVLRPLGVSRILFSRGADDDSNTNLNDAGYTDAPCVELTNCYRGGAFSLTRDSRLYGVGIQPTGHLRYAGTSDQATYAAGADIFVGKSGGMLREDDQALVQRAFSGAFHGALIATVPENAITGCDSYLAYAQFAGAGSLDASAGLPSFGGNLPPCRWGFQRRPVFKRGDAGGNRRPNQLKVFFNAPISTPVAKGYALAAGDIVILECDVVADVVYGELVKVDGQWDFKPDQTEWNRSVIASYADRA